MLGLVDYGDSSSESETEDNEKSEMPMETKAIKSEPVMDVIKSEKFDANGTTLEKSHISNSSIPFSTFRYEDDEVEENLKMRVPGNIKLEEILKPKPRKKKTEKIIITAPTVSDDSDSESESKKQKRVQPTSGPRKSLASLLPAPKAMIVREGNRPLIPHVVSRKATTSKPTAGKARQTQTAVKPSDTKLEDNDDQKKPETKMTSFFTLEDDDDDVVNDLPPPHKPAVEPVRNNVADLGSNLPSLPQTSVAAGPQLPSTEVSSSYPESLPLSGNAVPSDFIPESERRYQRKRKAGDIPLDIIDISQEQLTSGVEIELTKNISQEEDEFKKRPTEGMPSRLAASKHQITWLAHKAKEQEFELKNSWATAKFNKTQTRNKYGF